MDTSIYAVEVSIFNSKSATSYLLSMKCLIAQAIARYVWMTMWKSA